MRYSVRFAHLKKTPDLKIGEEIKPGDFLGTIGNTGQSFGRHLHIDCVEGSQVFVWTLNNMEKRMVIPAPRQLNYFIDEELFHNRYKITAHYADPEYQRRFNKVHHAYDIVLLCELPWEIFWNRTIPGKVILNEKHRFYGNVLIIEFDT